MKNRSAVSMLRFKLDSIRFFHLIVYIWREHG
jgi:hypothetical protein